MPYKSREKQKQYNLEYQRIWRKRNRKRMREIDRKSYYARTEKQKERKRKQNRERQKRMFPILRKQVLEKYGGIPSKCECCGETIMEFLTIDHINGDGHIDRKMSNRSGLYYYKCLLKEDIDRSKYRILCYNCNCFKKHDKDRICPHKLKR